MRYISEIDNKVFNTEQECLEHENAIRKSREELKRKEKLQMERQSRLDEIYKKVEDYVKDYREFECIYDPLIDLVNIICGKG